MKKHDGNFEEEKLDNDLSQLQEEISELKEITENISFAYICISNHFWYPSNHIYILRTKTQFLTF